MNEPIVHGSIPLSRAAVCINDDVIFHVGDGQCPVCTSARYVLLATWVPVMEMARETREQRGGTQ